ncbi:MAG: anthranilate synthase component I family protein [Acidobacteria bacterium]|nr:MAG: anthranilate synthase component I family protein [Acidobacteriota bacterium]
MTRGVATVDLDPMPDPGHLLLGLAALRDLGEKVEPFLLGGDASLFGEEEDPFLLMGAWPEDRLELARENGPDFPWETGAGDLLAAVEKFVGSQDDEDAAADDDPWRRPLTVGWIGHELPATVLSRHAAYLVLWPRRGVARAVAVAAADSTSADSAQARLALLVQDIHQAGARGRRLAPDLVGMPVASGAHAPVGSEQHGRRVQTVLDAIAAGDVYQVNLAHGLSLEGFPAENSRRAAAFLHLWRENPVSYPAYVQQGDTTMLSFSPERYLARRGAMLESRPIKGTRPRGETPAADARLARDLEVSAKDRAENIMIVDLVRNDLGRVAEIASVSVPVLCRLESFTSVHHLVSVVQARLRPGVGLAEILAAVHPPGSMTGAPKMRAVSLLAALEGEPRGIYAGGLAWFAGPARFHLSMVIRTILAGRTGASLHVGGGIVADSDPEDEYQETLHKADALLRSLAVPPGFARSREV